MMMPNLMPPTKKYSPAEPVTDLRHIKIVDNGEPLVNYLEMCPKLVKARPRWGYHRASFLRKSVAEKLCAAADALPKGYRFAVIEGWRPRYIQERMYLTSWKRWKDRHPDWSDVQLRRVVNRFTAPIHDRVPPPHSTGGALDLLLADDMGWEFDHTAPFEVFDPRVYALEAPGMNEETVKTRRILRDALLAGGLTNYPSEWWHWSYGDQGWAYRTGADHAIYGSTEPEGWSGFPEDMKDQPLVRADSATYR